MTKEEAKELVRQAIRDHLPFPGNEAEEAIEAISAEPDVILLSKGTLKYRLKGYVVYDVDWFKKNWRMELAIMGIDVGDIRPEGEDTAAYEAIAESLDEYGMDETDSIGHIPGDA